MQVYLLKDGKYDLDYVYQKFSDNDLKLLEDKERAAIKYEIPVSIFDDLIVDVRKIFRWWNEPL